VKISHDPAKIRVPVRVDSGDEELIVLRTRQLSKGNGVALKLGSKALNRLVGFGSDGIVCHNLQDQMRSTAQVEAEFDALIHVRNAGRKPCEQINTQNRDNGNNQQSRLNSSIHM
jgi:hypothetical protein